MDRCSYQLMIKLILAAGLAGCCLGMAQGQDVAKSFIVLQSTKLLYCNM